MQRKGNEMIGSSSNAPTCTKILRLYEAYFKLRKLKLLPEHLRHKIRITEKECNEVVGVYWGLNKSLIDDSKYPRTRHWDNVAKALRHVYPNLRIGRFIMVGDKKTLLVGFYDEIKAKSIKFIDTPERDVNHQ